MRPGSPTRKCDHVENDTVEFLKGASNETVNRLNKEWEARVFEWDDTREERRDGVKREVGRYIRGRRDDVRGREFGCGGGVDGEGLVLLFVEMVEC